MAAAHPEIVQKMRAYYDGWWADVEPRVNEFSLIPLPARSGETVLLSAADWHDLLLDQQLQVRNGLARNAPWSLEVVEAGDYVFELRRWPRDADVALSTDCRRISLLTANFRPARRSPSPGRNCAVGNRDWTSDVKATDKSISFNVPLKAGPMPAQTWFYDEAGAELCGAYYVYVTRK